MRIDPNLITTCEASNIIEAWVILRGPPDELNDHRKKLLEDTVASARNEIKDLKNVPAMILVPQGGKVPPLWLHQMSWNNDKNLVRIGHQFLSVHRLIKGEDKYSRFSKEVAPGLDQWLALIDETISIPEMRQINNVGAGYINKFVWTEPNSNFNPNTKFNLGITVQIDRNGNPPMSSMGGVFTFEDKTENINFLLDVKIKNVPGQQNTFEAMVQCLAESSVRLSYDDLSQVESAIKKCRTYAKLKFFNFLTNDSLKSLKPSF